MNPQGFDPSDFNPNNGRKDYVLPLVPNASFFNIYHCDENGRPDKKYHPKSAISTCVCTFANVTLKMTQTPKTLDSLVKMATIFGQARPNAWFLQGPDSKEKKIFRAAKKFQGFFENGFPLLIADDSMKNRTNEAISARGEWEIFKLADQAIRLNGLVSIN